VATALVAEIAVEGLWKAFSSGRGVAAWIGLVPKQHTTGGKDKLGSITKQGNRYLRWLLVSGAMAVNAANELNKYLDARLRHKN
jgi:transposase